ncbi:MAG: response regulator, partial [Candidatus Limnocylindria bacterium]
MKVLLVDDDRELVDMLVFAFGRAGLTTTTAHDVASGLARFEQDRPDLMVLDLHLGGSDGFDLLRQVRERSQVPIIILSALDSDDDKVKGLSLGADDYVTKPFSHRELLTRILMRLRRPGQAAPRPLPDVLRVADIELDASAHTVQRAGRPVNLTVTEFRLLHHLLVNAGQVVSTEDILRHVWGNPDPTDSDVLRVTLHRLRRKLGETGASQGILRTVPGVGVLLQGERVTSPEPAPREEEAVAPAEPATAPVQPAVSPAAQASPAEQAPQSEAAPSRPIRAPVLTPAPPPQRGGRVERDGQDRLRLRFQPDAEVESVLFVTPAATLERYDAQTGEVTWTMPARGERAWDVFDVARRRGFTFAPDIDVPAPSANGGSAVLTAPVAAPVGPGPGAVDEIGEPAQPGRDAQADTPRAQQAGPSAVAAIARVGAARAADGLA